MTDTPPPESAPEAESSPQALRRAARARALARSRPLRVMAFTSGKGGVGKTNVTLNLAVSFAQMGRKVLVVDGDVGLANVDILLDETPPYTFLDLVRGERTLEEVLFRSELGLTLLPGSSGAWELTELDDRARLGLLDAFESLDEDFDTVLVDTAAGLGANTRFFASAAEDVFVVATPEPTSLADAYGALKVLSGKCGVSRVGLIVNDAMDEDDARETYDHLAAIAGRFLPLVLDFAGYVPSDPHLREAVMQQSPVVVEYPASPASSALRALADRLLSRQPGGAAGTSGTRADRLQLFWRRLTGVGGEDGEAPQGARARDAGDARMRGVDD